MTQRITQSADAPLAEAGQRLDQCAARMFPEFSRERLKAWIRDGSLTVDGRPGKPTQRITGGEHLNLDVALPNQGDWQAERMDICVIDEDQAIAVIDKPAGLVVHPAAGNYNGTLLNGLLARYPQLKQVPRAGIVHRLDKDTTGLMVVAKTLEAQYQLVDLLQRRQVSREYLAVVYGHPPASGEVDAAIGRDPHNRKRMAVTANGKEAITHYWVEKRWPGLSLLRLQLQTGRTHQIRVHMTHIGHPLVGDATYRRHAPPASALATPLAAAVQSFARQALHARRLGLIHPVTQRACEWQSPLPNDFADLLTALDAAAPL